MTGSRLWITKSMSKTILLQYLYFTKKRALTREESSFIPSKSTANPHFIKLLKLW